jgi:hypothetical protein
MELYLCAPYILHVLQRNDCTFFIIPCLDVLDPAWVTNSIAKQYFVLVAVRSVPVCLPSLRSTLQVFSCEDYHSEPGLVRS